MIKVFSGSQVTIEYLKARLEEIGIGSVIKNDFQSGIIAGFGAVPSTVELFIDESNLSEANEIIIEFSENQKSE